MGLLTRTTCLAAGALLAAALCAGDEPPALVVNGVPLSHEEVELALELSPLPAPPPDPTNAVYEDAAAARLGQALFFEPRLSGSGTFSCATCHDPAQGWADGRELAQATAHHPRHTMSLWNVAWNRWFFWDGRKDTLWSQALAPLEDPREQAGSRLRAVRFVLSDPAYARAYEQVFGAAPDLAGIPVDLADARPVSGEPEHPHDVAWRSLSPEQREGIDQVFVRLGKAIAAFERRIVSGNSRFDVFVQGLREDDPVKRGALDARELSGLRTFLGKGRCLLCHDGPNFTDSEFHDNRVPTSEGVDPGRILGLVAVKNDDFRSSGRHSDAPAAGSAKLDFLAIDDHSRKREFKTPTLRNVARTAPYMHEGQIATLAEVVEFYSTLAGATAPSVSGERIVQPLHLTAEEQADLVAFLESLTDETLPAELLGPPPEPFLPEPEDR
jgi:cytochrome c peroxidase